MDINNDAKISYQTGKEKSYSNVDSSTKIAFKRQRPPSPTPYALHVKEEIVTKGDIIISFLFF